MTKIFRVAEQQRTPEAVAVLAKCCQKWSDSKSWLNEVCKPVLSIESVVTSAVPGMYTWVTTAGMLHLLGYMNSVSPKRFVD